MFNKTKLLPVMLFIILIPVVVVLQNLILADHLKYGFRDMDWVFIKDFKKILPLTVSSLIIGWKHWGVYTYQMFYVGIPAEVFGIDFKALQGFTHFFKLLSVLSVFPLILVISKNKILALTATLLYASTYPAVGAMFSVVTSGNYVAVVVMNVFLTFYWYMRENVKEGLLDWILATLLLLATLFLSTERMYPLIAFLTITEVAIYLSNGFSKASLKASSKMLAFFLSPIILGIMLSPQAFTQFFGNTESLFNHLHRGDLHLLLTPLATLGSLFIPDAYLKILGTPSIDSLKFFIFYFLGWPVIIFGFLTLIIRNVLSIRKTRFIWITFTLFVLILGYVYITCKLAFDSREVLRNLYEDYYLGNILMGSFILSISIGLFLEWQKSRDRAILILSMGPIFAYIFISLTWFFSDPELIFIGPHRYLTVPALGSCLFLGSLIVLIYQKLLKTVFAKVAWGVFILLIPITIMNYFIVSNFFKDELQNSGMDALEQTRMKNKLWSYLGNFSDTEPSFFYFDESADYQNGYFHESTILAGFNTWMLFRGNSIVSDKLTPTMVRTNILCPGEKQNCTDKLVKFVMEKNGKKSIYYNDIYFLPGNFYAFRLKERDIINITEEVKGKIGIK